ncbi:hypothetical protein [Rhizobium laguerreae]|nr:hypothetical protein [Rhizobium laguerreae]
MTNVRAPFWTAACHREPYHYARADIGPSVFVDALTVGRLVFDMR